MKLAEEKAKWQVAESKKDLQVKSAEKAKERKEPKKMTKSIDDGQISDKIPEFETVDKKSDKKKKKIVKDEQGQASAPEVQAKRDDIWRHHN